MQLAVGIQFAQRELAQALLARPALEGWSLVASDPFGKRVRLGPVQQRLGVAVEFRAGDRIGVGKEPAQAIEALFLILEAFFDTAVAFAGQQLEALAQLMVKQVQRRPGEQCRESPADEQDHERDQPGRDIFADKTQDLGAHGVQRHRRNSKRQVRESPLAMS
ncbi:hypothetical protein D3C81_1599400 [compost metagenome]